LLFLVEIGKQQDDPDYADDTGKSDTQTAHTSGKSIYLIGLGCAHGM
jgi:hypothetical protein